MSLGLTLWKAPLATKSVWVRPQATCDTCHSEPQDLSGGTPGSSGTPASWSLGWGSATDPATADDLARAEVAKTFSVTIEQVAQSRQQATVQRTALGVVTASRSEQRSDTKSATRATLKGVDGRVRLHEQYIQCSVVQ